MNKYEVYQIGKVPPLAVVEADDFDVDYDLKKICFRKGMENIAIFNWNNISGFRKVKDEQHED